MAEALFFCVFQMSQGYSRMLFGIVIWIVNRSWQEFFGYGLLLGDIMNYHCR